MDHPDGTDSSAGHILARTLRRVELFQQAGDDWRFAESLKSISEDTAQEYEGRTLLELVQNGHDALEAGEPGRVLVRLDLRAAARVVYVANEGNGFSAGNFRAITEFALSDKGAGEGIGNKGLGFRSVLQLTDWPEVYSKRDAASSTFDGYCFRFAAPADLNRLLDKDLAAEVCTKVSPLMLPVPAELDDPVLAALAADGYSTVVRLPLRNPAAAEEARRQAEELTSDEAPLLLFLDRIRELAVEVVTDGGEPWHRRLTRTVMPTDLVRDPNEDGVRAIDLGDGGRYLLARRTVSPESLGEAISQSIEARQIDGRWKDWQGEAWVGIALRLDQDLPRGRMYTHLPMASESPLCAHVHAPFFTKLARLDISQAVALNDFLLDEIAGLAAALATRLRDEGPRDRAAGPVLDLLCWKPADRINRAFAGQLADEPFVPLTGEVPWGTLRQSSTWPDQDRAWRVVTADALASVGALIVEPRTAPARRQRLDALHLALLRTRMRADEGSAARWVEGVATALAASTDPHEAGTTWADYYDDIAYFFARSPRTLCGKRIVIDENGSLQPTLGHPQEPGRPEGVVFFSPQDGAEGGGSRISSDLRALRRRIAFTHPAVAWRSLGRFFLEQHGLVRAHDLDQVLTALRELLVANMSDALRRDALVFVQRQYPSLSEGQRRLLHKLKLFVPLADGRWKPASQCSFSPAWGTDGATRLARVLEAGGSGVPGLVAQCDMWIADPGSWPVKVESREEYAEFLARIGVRDGLVLGTTGRPIGQHKGREFQPGTLAARLDLGSRQTDAWTLAVRDTNWRGGNHPFTPYVFETRPYTLPGAVEMEALPTAARREFAALVLLGLRTWPEGAFSTTVYRPNHHHKPDEHIWPTPLAAFLRHLPWLPVQYGEEGIRYVTPNEAWFSPDREPPPFVASLPQPVRSLLADQHTVTRLRRLGLRIWDDPEFAAAAVHDLGSALAAGHVPEHLSISFKKQYGRAIEQAAQAGDWPWPAGKPVQLAVVTGPLLTALTPSPGGVYIADEAASLKESLIELVNQPMLVTAAGPGSVTVARLLEANNVPVTLLSATQVQVRQPGGDLVTADDAQELLADGREWLVTLVALVLELKSGAFLRHSEQRIRTLMERLRSIRLVRLDSVEIVVAGTSSAPPTTARSLPLSDDARPTVVVWDCHDGWEEVRACASAVAQLLQQPSLHDSLELALVKLQQFLGEDHLPDQLDDEALAFALSTTSARVAELRRNLSGEVLTAVHRLRPVLVCLVGRGRMEEITDTLGRTTSEERLRQVLADYQGLLPTTGPNLLELLRAASGLAELRDVLALNFVQFNEALTVLGPPYRPLRHPDRHEEAFADFLRKHAPAISERLREFYAEAAGEGHDVSGYPHARLLEGLTPDPTWLDRFACPPDEVMRERTAVWLRSLGADDDLDSPGVLKPVEEMRTDNVVRLAELVDQLVPLVAAWSAHHGVARPSAWTGAPGLTATSHLERSGMGDLVVLDRDQLLQMIAHGVGMPPGMPLSTDPVALGLTGENAPRTTTGQGTPTSPPLARAMIALGDTELHVGTDQFARIAELASRSVDEAFLALPGKASLSPMASGRRHGTTGSSGIRTVVARTGTPGDDERAAIGLVGEVVARLWLERRYAEVHWRSGYAAVVHGDPAASDSHGFDFEVRRGNTVVYYEVKSTTQPVSERTEFEMGESELRTAQRHSNNNRYRILLVTSALDPSIRQIFELPSPFSAKGRERFRVVGQGLRYRCAPTGVARRTS
ncbi:sacsin N-terminal ATP-binding-like domain-containing protein [Kitasatospora indigofera]|uniref:sacsin N-terminal ATP-binding-like domain-containing protein n=1 Tax=Kitasatospora indigofera TaxID=67307 RepID=UPI00362D4624